MQETDAAAALFRDAYNDSPAVMAAAPGRIEFIGNHTDYNGGRVIGAAIDRLVSVALQKRKDRRIRICSTTRNAMVILDLDQIARQEGKRTWANYPLGVLVMLQREGLQVDTGFDMAIASTIPVGAGLSSSAALELAVAYGLAEAYGGQFDRASMARIGRRAENEFVGVPCGILDQGVSAFAEKDHLVLIDCKIEAFDAVPLPHDTAFWIFNSHKKHALIGSLYATRHQECTQARDALAAFYPGTDYLADFTPDQVEAHRDDLPEHLYKRALHITSENQRVKEMSGVLEAGNIKRAGELLVASHASSRDLFENSTPELDFLVDQLAAAENVFGARLTGGGFGGAVMALTNTRFSEEQAGAIAARYRDRFGNAPDVLYCHTSSGAAVL